MNCPYCNAERLGDDLTCLACGATEPRPEYAARLVKKWRRRSWVAYGLLIPTALAVGAFAYVRARPHMSGSAAIQTGLLASVALCLLVSFASYCIAWQLKDADQSSLIDNFIGLLGSALLISGIAIDNFAPDTPNIRAIVWILFGASTVIAIRTIIHVSRRIARQQAESARRAIAP